MHLKWGKMYSSENIQSLLQFLTEHNHSSFIYCYWKHLKINSAGADGGPRSAPRSAHFWTTAQAPSTPAEKNSAHISAGGKKCIFWSVFPPFQEILSTFHVFLKSLKNCRPPKNVSPQILFFLWVKPHAKFPESYDNPFWEKGNWSRKKERKKRR